MIRRRLVYNKVELTPLDWKFYLALVVAALLTIVSYYFLIGSRELYRHIAVHDYPAFVSLTPLRRYLYDLFFALLSTFVGFMVFTKMWVPSNLLIHPFIRTRILFDQQYVPGMFIYLFLKLGLFFCFLIQGNLIFNYLDVGKELWPLFAVAPIFLFMHQWMTLRLRIKQATTKVMLVIGGLQIVFAGVIAAIPFHDFSKLDEQSARRSPTEMLKIDIPESRYSGLTTRGWTKDDLIIGFRKDNGELVTSLGHFKSDFITPDTLVSRFIKVRAETELNFEKPMVELYADKAVPATNVIATIQVLKQTGTLQYRLIANDRYGGFGLPLSVPGYCKDISDEMNLTYIGFAYWGDTVIFHKPQPCPTISDYKGYEVYTLSFENNSILLNDTVRTRQQIYDWAYARIMRQHDSGGKETIIIPEADESTTYETFFGAYEEMYNAIVDIRTRKLKEYSGAGYQHDPAFRAYEMKSDDIAYANKYKEIFWQIIAPGEEDFYRDFFAELKRNQEH